MPVKNLAMEERASGPIRERESKEGPAIQTTIPAKSHRLAPPPDWLVGARVLQRKRKIPKKMEDYHNEHVISL
jgi:hypothetical protein